MLWQQFSKKFYFKWFVYHEMCFKYWWFLIFVPIVFSDQKEQNITLKEIADQVRELKNGQQNPGKWMFTFRQIITTIQQYLNVSVPLPVLTHTHMW